MEKEKKKKTYASTWSNILWTIQKQRRYAPSVLFMQMIGVPVHVGLAWAGIYLPALVVAEVIEGRGAAHAAYSVGLLMFAILCANIVESITSRIMAGREIPYRSQIIYELNKKALTLFYQIYEKKEMRDLRDRAEVATQMWNGVQPIRDMTKHAWDFLESILCYVLFGTVLSFVNPWLILILTLAPAVNYFCVKAYQKWEYANREKWTDIDRKMWYVQEKTADFSAAKDIRIYGMTKWLCETYRTLCTERGLWDKKNIRRSYLSQFADLLLILVRDGAAYAILIAMARAGEITTDQFVLYFAAISSFASWIGNIINKWNWMRSTSLRLCDLREYLEYPEEDGDGAAKIEDFLSGAPEIVFDHVSFRYDGAKEDTLHDICFTLHSGERLAVVGLNGAGKTTLIKLLCGLYRPTSGEIRILAASGNVAVTQKSAAEKDFAAKGNTAAEEKRGVPIRHFYRRDYYRLFSAVFQKVNSSFYSLAEMVSGQEEEKTDLARAESCMRQAGLGKKLDSLPKGIFSRLDKQVNKDGIELSGGEMQKLMLARALYKDAPVLVLDEPTAALDPIAESGIYEQYKNMTHGKSSLFISHRLASTRFCDRILYLQDGRILEEGTHDALAAAGGEYAKLYEMQSCWYQEKGGAKEEGNAGVPEGS